MSMRQVQNSRGVALIIALFVLMVLSILGIGLLTNVDDELKMSKGMENSERALKIAEIGIQIARAKFFDPSVKQITQTVEISPVDGFYHGGYFLAQLESGFRGNEKWTQWRYDEGVSAHNPVSEIVVPVFRVWATGDTGVNGSWAYEGPQAKWMFRTRNLYPVVARGTYFSMEQVSGDTLIRAHDEYTGEQEVKNEGETTTYWKDDKSVLNTGSSNSATMMSAMASFSNYSTVPGATEPVLVSQKLYFTYTGHDSQDIAASAADTVSTVRLVAANALNNNTNDGDPVSKVWEFDTGMHGMGTAPAFFDPDPATIGDEVIYFVVLSVGDPGASGTLDINQTGSDKFVNFPSKATDAPEQIYIYAVVDLGTTYSVKWAHPYPNPDLANSTDYPVQVTATSGQNPPYVRVAADMSPFMPENDLLPDYRDGTGVSGKFNYDGQQNLIRGNIAWAFPPALSPPVVNVLYEDSSGNLTSDRESATEASKDDPRIDIYVAYSARSRVAFYRGNNAAPHWVQTVEWSPPDSATVNTGWGPAGLRKPNTIQTRVMSLRDQFVRKADDSGWNWNAPASRFPKFKWTYRVPGHDPSGTDVRPWNGYGEYTWDTNFLQDVAPLVRLAETDQSRRPWSTVGTGGSQNLYPVIYVAYRSIGYPSTSYNNNVVAGTRGPTSAEGSPVDFSDQAWSDARLMMMAIRDTWDDYMDGNQTNYLYSSMNVTWSNRSLTNPVEPYWVHDHTNHNSTNSDWINACDTATSGCPPIAHTYPAYPNYTVITYNMTDNDTAGNTLQMPYPANTNKIGFPRPYTWSESLWNAQVRDAAQDLPWSMFQQGWEGTGFDSSDKDNSKNLDVRGDNSAMCVDCLYGDGLLVVSFIHNLTKKTSGNFKQGDDRIDLRLHGINATTGVHIWDFHAPSNMYGDYNNASPAIANNKVFLAYKKYGERKVILEALSTTDGQREQEPVVVDEDADAVILSPSIANGAVYIGTYSLGDNVPPDGNSGVNPYASTYTDDDYIRLFALSPVLRLVSTGVYPFNYANYTGNNFRNITMLDHDTIVKDTGESYITGQGRVPTSKRKLQVWITGGNSKWEEVREVFER